MSKHTIKFVVKNYDFQTMLDIGAGIGVDVGEAKKLKPEIEVTLIDLVPLEERAPEDNVSLSLGNWLIMNFLDYSEEKQFDFVNCSHCLEHQLDLHIFLKKLIRCTKDDGIIAVTVPPINYSNGIVGGHVNLFTTEILLYRMLLAGLDLSLACVIEWKWDIAIIVRKKLIDLPYLIGGVGNRPELFEMKKWLPPMTWTDDPLFEGRLKNVIKE